MFFVIFKLFKAIKTDYLLYLNHYLLLSQLLIFIKYLFLIFFEYFILLLLYVPRVFSLLVAQSSFFLSSIVLTYLILVTKILPFLFLTTFILALLFFVLFFHFLLKVLNVSLLEILIHLTIISIYPFQNLHHLFINFSKFYQIYFFFVFQRIFKLPHKYY